MSNIQNSLFEAMKIFSENAKTTSNSAMTIEGVITEVLDAGLGQYTLEYLGNTFTVYSNSNIAYSVGDIVYVLIPERDFTKMKIIISKVSNRDTIALALENSENNSRAVSDNLINYNEVVELNSYISESKTVSLDTENFSALVNNYLNEGYNNFTFSLNVKTNLDNSQQSGGNYGAILELPLIAAGAEGITDLVWKSYTLDVNNMLGSPYHFQTWSPQQLNFFIDSEQYKLSSAFKPKLTFFCKDFTQDLSKTDNVDIWLKDFNLELIDYFSDEDKKGYNLFIQSTEGIFFYNNSSNTKTLTPSLNIDGRKTLLSGKNSEIYWFIEDVEVNQNHADYCSYGGLGWRCLNAKTNTLLNPDGVESFDWVTNELTHDISREEAAAATRIKCVVIYNDKRLSSIITLKNLDYKMDLILKATNGSNVFIKDTGYAHLSAFVYYENITDKEDYKNSVLCNWTRYDRNGNYINDQDSFFEIVRNNEEITIDDKIYYETEIRFPVNQVDTINTIYCSAKFVNNGDKKLIGTKEIVISTSDNFDYNLIINNDDIIYKYDVDGDSPAGTAYDGPSTSKVTNIAPLDFTIQKASGDELTEEEYLHVKYTWKIPKKSLFLVTDYTSSDDDFYYKEGYGKGSLAYKIANRYNTSYANNGIELKIVLNNATYTSRSQINFIKEGQSGSNGTIYAGRLVYGGISPSSSYPYGGLNNEGIAEKLKLVYNIEENILYTYDYDTYKLIPWNEGKRRIYPLVYENSELLDTSNYTISYSMFDANSLNPCLTIGEIQESTNGVFVELEQVPEFNNTYNNVVQATIIVNQGNSSAVNARNILYIYYPIDFIIVNKLTNVDQFRLPSLDGGYAEVVYASDGTNPSWDETSDFRTWVPAVQDFNLDDYYNLYINGSEHFIKKNNGKIVPPSKYDNGNSNNYIYLEGEVDPTKMDKLYNDIIEKNNEISTISDEIQDLEESYAELVDFKSNYFCPEWKVNLNYINPLLSKRTSLIYYADLLQNTNLQRLNDYLDSKENVDASFVNELKNIFNLQSFEEDLELAKVKIYNYGFTSEDIDLISLEQFIITISAELKTRITNIFGSNSALQIQLLVDDLNTQIENYQTVLNQIQELSDIYLNTYTNLCSDIRDVAEMISADKYLDIRDNLLHELDTFKNYTSLKDLTNVVNGFYNNVLKNIFTLNDAEVLNIRQNVTKDNNENIARLTKDKEENVKYLNNLLSIRENLDTKFYYTRPIVFYFNRYEMSNINGWDGNKIETGANDEYLLAPQVGAGHKENDNSFTGIIIGERIVENTAQTGMFGYASGVQSLFLNAQNGSAVFGKNDGGQIVIDPSSTQSLLYSGIYWKNYDNKTKLPTNYTDDNKSGKGLCINLQSGDIHIANNQGKIYSGSHSTLNSTSNGFYLSQDGLSIGSKFSVTAAGVLTATDGTFTGKITATDGAIGGWTIGATSLSAKGITISSSGSISGDGSGGGTWSINRGKATFNNAEITGKITSSSGQIGGFTISGSSLYSSKTVNGITYRNDFMSNEAGDPSRTALIVRHSSDGGAHWTNSFYVRYNGELHAENVNVTGTITANAGNIGGTTNIGLGNASSAGNNGIYWDGRTCSIAGNIYANNGYFSGEVHASSGSFKGSVTATSGSFTGSLHSSEGEIGGWNLSGKGFSKGDMQLLSNGLAIIDDLSCNTGNFKKSLSVKNKLVGIAGTYTVVDGKVTIPSS
jgi:hypothetical protein